MKIHVFSVVKTRTKSSPAHLVARIIIHGKSINSTQALVSATMPILRLFRTAAFDPEATETLTSAFDTAWNVLRRSGSTLVANDKAVMTREVLATQIIALGRTGERNQERLVKDALAHVASCETISRGVARVQAKRNGR
jgi:hypothetical protein